jgi:hypothetical protein
MTASSWNQTYCSQQQRDLNQKNHFGLKNVFSAPQRLGSTMSLIRRCPKIGKSVSIPASNPVGRTNCNTITNRTSINANVDLIKSYISYSFLQEPANDYLRGLVRFKVLPTNLLSTWNGVSRFQYPTTFEAKLKIEHKSVNGNIDSVMNTSYNVCPIY